MEAEAIPTLCPGDRGGKVLYQGPARGVVKARASITGQYLSGRRQVADARAGGFTDWLDRLVEKATRVPGRAMWREMKAGAKLPFQAAAQEPSQTPAGAGTQTLEAFLNAMARTGKSKKLHLVGHSTGMILVSYLLERLSLLAPDNAVASVSLMAPAGTIDLFDRHLQPFLKAIPPAFRISKMGIYNLTDKLEQDDEVSKAYNKSLLYLVSRAFEEVTPERILGMQNYSQAIERRNLSRLEIHYSKGPGGVVTASETHGGFDNDPKTMNHILRRILRSSNQQPAQEFTQDSLDY